MGVSTGICFLPYRLVKPAIKYLFNSRLVAYCVVSAVCVSGIDEKDPNLGIQ